MPRSGSVPAGPAHHSQSIFWARAVFRGRCSTSTPMTVPDTIGVFPGLLQRWRWLSRGCSPVEEVISSDSDLKEPIAVVQRQLRIPVGVINPHREMHHSRTLQPASFKQLRPSVLPSCQFPPLLQDTRGMTRKPVGW